MNQVKALPLDGIEHCIGKRTGYHIGAERTVRRIGRSFWTRSLALAGAAAIAGCGGGGDKTDGGIGVVPGPPTATPTPTSPTTPTPTAEQLEAGRSNAAIAANAAAAYAAGATGRGIRIAVIDTGISAGLAEFAGRIDPASADVAGNRGLVDQNGHGTWVSSVALAARDGIGMHGMAFEATLISFNISSPTECTPQACPSSSGPVRRAIDAAVAAGARIISMSLSSDQIDENLLAAVRRAAAANVVLVIAAGNQQADEPRLLTRAVAEAGAGSVIIAGAHDAGGSPYAFNNRAGSGPAAASYLMALGVDVVMTGRDGSLVTQSGTSFATAAISGAAALVAQARPALTGSQIVSALLVNATDVGAPGRDPVYGNGILNLSATFAALQR